MTIRMRILNAQCTRIFQLHVTLQYNITCVCTRTMRTIIVETRRAVAMTTARCERNSIRINHVTRTRKIYCLCMRTAANAHRDRSATVRCVAWCPTSIHVHTSRSACSRQRHTVLLRCAPRTDWHIPAWYDTAYCDMTRTSQLVAFAHTTITTQCNAMSRQTGSMRE
jgi:hypothetical protein